MIQKSSVLVPEDNCGILKVRVFHVYKGSKGRIALNGDFLKVSAREVLPDNIYKKKSKHRAILIKTKFKNNWKDGSFVCFKNNSLVLLKKRLTPKGVLLKGAISKNIKRKKFSSSFSQSI